MTIDDNDRLRAGDLGSPMDGTVPADPGCGDPVIVVVKGAWFMREPTGYYQITEKLAAVDISRVHPTVEVTYETESGAVKPLTPSQIYDRHGVRADTLTYEMGHRGRFVPRAPGHGGELVIGCCLPLEMEPTYDEQVDNWLVRLAGPHYHRVNDWLACSMDLQRPIAAIYLRGDPSCGKSMFADGVAAAYGPHRTSYADVVLGSYTGALLRCPIVHLDERAPEDRTGRASGAFRELIGNSTRPLTEKYAPAATIKGCPRLVITSNDDDALRLSPEDQRRADDAIGIRILHVPCQQDAVEYLASIGGRSGTADWVTDPDGGPGRIPRHVWWLARNWRITRPGSRLLVEGDAASWTQSVAARRGLPQRILVAVARILAREVPVPLHARTPCWVHGDAVAVSVTALRDVWREAAGDDTRPGEQAVGAALARIGTRARIERDGGRPWVYVIDREVLIEAVEVSGCVDVEALPEPIRRHS